MSPSPIDLDDAYRILTELALRYPKQRKGLLAIQGAVLRDLEKEGKQRPASWSEVAVYALYKGQRKEATFSKSSGRIRYKGKEYSPSKAASRVCGGSAVNGWRFWRCRDPKTGQDRFIDDVFRDR